MNARASESANRRSTRHLYYIDGVVSTFTQKFIREAHTNFSELVDLFLFALWVIGIGIGMRWWPNCERGAERCGK